MNEAKIPTLIGIIILVLGIGLAVFLVQSRQIFRLGASTEVTPKDVRITNITDSSFTVSWITEKETLGFIQWGLSEGDLENTETDEVGVPNLTHTATVVGLRPETAYFFKIGSGGILYDNNRIPWNLRTGQQGSQNPNPVIVSGSVVTSTGEPAKFALVYLTFAGQTPLSSMTSENGNWVIPIFSHIASTSLIEIAVNAGVAGVSSAQIFLASANPVPPIVLGQVHDFRNLPESSPGNLPTSSIGVPEGQERPSGFSIPEGGTLTSQAVTLSSIDQGETITSTTPEFFGEGPAGTTISITVESEPVTTQVRIPSSGDWKWAVPTNLSPGTHKITISWKDVSGITRTLTRTFIVQAAEGPAFESSPSGSLTPSPTPTVTPLLSPTATPTTTPTVRPTATPIATVSPTAVPIPESGSLTPTILLTIMGIVTFLASLIFWKYADA